MTNQPRTTQQLNEIEQRATAATPGPWEQYPGYGRTFYANTTGPHLRGVGDLEFGDGDAAEADETFVRHAQQDVTALLAYVRRLQQQRKYLIGQLAKRDAETGNADRALREFLGAHPDEDEMAASMVRDGFGPAEVVDILRSSVAAPAAVETGTLAAEHTASLLVDRTSSTCGACGQPTLPSALTHANVSGYDPKPGGGCGARFTAIRSVNRAVTKKDLRSLRPDLPLAP